jgi:hypothetical protein
MAKKAIRRVHHRKTVKAVKAKPAADTLVMVQGWMFVVAFALMLGIGAIVGTYVNKVMNENVPTVAGVSVSR